MIGKPVILNVKGEVIPQGWMKIQGHLLREGFIYQFGGRRTRASFVALTSAPKGSFIKVRV